MSEVVIQAPRRGEIPRVQIADLCEGCISLSNAEGFGERLFHFSYIIPIVAMTANAFEEDRQKAFKAGMNAHIAKPIDVNILMGTLDRVFKQNS